MSWKNTNMKEVLALNVHAGNRNVLATIWSLMDHWERCWPVGKVAVKSLNTWEYYGEKQRAVPSVWRESFILIHLRWNVYMVRASARVSAMCIHPSIHPSHARNNVLGIRVRSVLSWYTHIYIRVGYRRPASFETSWSKSIDPRS